MSAGGDHLDLESIDDYLRTDGNGTIGLESPDVYLKRVKAAIKLSKARAANIVALVLVIGVVLSLPLHAVTLFLTSPDAYKEVNDVFSKWYDVVVPLLGVVIGAMFGISIASREKD